MIRAIEAARTKRPPSRRQGIVGETVALDDRQTLDDMLSGISSKPGQAVALTVRRIAEVAIRLSTIIGAGALSCDSTAALGENDAGDPQTEMDRRAHAMFLAGLREAPVAVVGSEGASNPVMLDDTAPLVVAIDPLDGSSNIDTNIPSGSIFSILPMVSASNGSRAAAVLQPGSNLLAAGFVIYGPQTCLVMTLGEGTQVFTLDRESNRFVLTRPRVLIPEQRREYAINAVNYRHWDRAVRTWVDDCAAGVDGPRGANFSMRWIASLVAEAFRILRRGGVFLYPADRRPGYEQGRLSLVYEAQPLAMIMEQAGGGAIDGFNRILDLVPQDLHQRTPLIFGSADKVARVARYHAGPPSTSLRWPLFAPRGLFYQP
jgi:fructose-1,6-bisphosphatase I